MTEETDEPADIDFLKQIEVSDEDIANVKQKVNKRKKTEYVLTPARLRQQEEMRKEGWRKRREAKEIKDRLIQEKLKDYKAKADQKMKADIIKTATKIMRDDRAIQNAVRKVFSDVDYNPVVYNELIKIVSKIQEKNPQQPTNQYSFS